MKGPKTINFKYASALKERCTLHSVLKRTLCSVLCALYSVISKNTVLWTLMH